MKNLRIATFNVNGMRARLPNLLEWLKRDPVSYTHLTLPTICSV